MASSGPQQTPHASWPIDQRVYCVQHHQKHGSFKRLRADFLAKFETQRAPSISVVQRWISNFSRFGSVRNHNAASNYKSSHSGRPRKRSREVIEEVSSSILRSPKRTLRKRAQCMGLSATTCWRVMRRDLKLFPYRIQTLQTLSESDKSKKINHVY